MVVQAGHIGAVHMEAVHMEVVHRVDHMGVVQADHKEVVPLVLVDTQQDRHLAAVGGTLLPPGHSLGAPVESL